MVLSHEHFAFSFFWALPQLKKLWSRFAGLRFATVFLPKKWQKELNPFNR
jgi:hypothetical protein